MTRCLCQMPSLRNDPRCRGPRPAGRHFHRYSFSKFVPTRFAPHQFFARALEPEQRKASRGSTLLHRPLVGFGAAVAAPRLRQPISIGCMTLDRGSVSWPKGASTLPSVFGGTRPERDAPESEGSRQVAVQAKFPPWQGRPNRPRISGIFTDRGAARSTGTMGKSPMPLRRLWCLASRWLSCAPRHRAGPEAVSVRAGAGVRPGGIG